MPSLDQVGGRHGASGSVAGGSRSSCQALKGRTCFQAQIVPGADARARARAAREQGFGHGLRIGGAQCGGDGAGGAKLRVRGRGG
eukprot:scaffold106_cov246-Pinguiococcus_pyrenoidosus.AAC.16